jgi:hypothetical protein
MPAFEVITKLLIEHAGLHLEQPMCTGHRPSHLLLLDEPFADDLVDSRLDKASRDWLAVPVTISVIRDRRHVGRYVIDEFVQFILYGGCARRFSPDFPGQLHQCA